MENIEIDGSERPKSNWKKFKNGMKAIFILKKTKNDSIQKEKIVDQDFIKYVTLLIELN